jgi:hypothetical protein
VVGQYRKRPVQHSDGRLPADTGGELTIQVTHQETKHSFTTRARIARDADEPDDSDPVDRPAAAVDADLR